MREAPQRTFYAQYHFSLSQINLYMYSCFKRLRTDIKSLDDEIQVISFFVFNFFGHVHPTLFLFIYLVLVALGLCCCMWAFSSYKSRGLLSGWVGTGFSLWRLLLLQSTGSRCLGFRSCSMQAQELRLAGSWVPGRPQLWDRGAHQPWLMGPRMQTRQL